MCFVFDDVEVFSILLYQTYFLLLLLLLSQHLLFLAPPLLQLLRLCRPVMVVRAAITPHHSPPLLSSAIKTLAEYRKGRKWTVLVLAQPAVSGGAPPDLRSVQCRDAFFCTNSFYLFVSPQTFFVSRKRKIMCSVMDRVHLHRNLILHYSFVRKAL